MQLQVLISFFFAYMAAVQAAPVHLPKEASPVGIKTPDVALPHAPRAVGGIVHGVKAPVVPSAHGDPRPNVPVPHRPAIPSTEGFVHRRQVEDLSLNGIPAGDAVNAIRGALSGADRLRRHVPSSVGNTASGTVDTIHHQADVPAVGVPDAKNQVPPFVRLVQKRQVDVPPVAAPGVPAHAPDVPEVTPPTTDVPLLRAIRKRQVEVPSTGDVPVSTPSPHIPQVPPFVRLIAKRQVEGGIPATPELHDVVADVAKGASGRASEFGHSIGRFYEKRQITVEEPVVDSPVPDVETPCNPSLPKV